MQRVKDKVTIVTGGAKNIGKAISLLLAENGAKVCIFDIDEINGTKTAELIERKYGEGCFIKCDVTSLEEINHAVKIVLKRYKRIDALVNNVGAPIGITLDDIDEKKFQENIEINLKSAVFCTKSVLPAMIEQKYGSVVYISSINALLGGFSEIGYSIAKAGLHTLVKVLTADYSKYNIRFNTVCLGSIMGETNIWLEREKEMPGVLSNLSKIYPIGRVGTPKDVAYAVLFLVSDESSWITGTTLIVDGGITATGNLPGGKWWEKL